MHMVKPARAPRRRGRSRLAQGLVAGAVAVLASGIAITAIAPAAQAENAVGPRAAALATANVGHSACGTNSLGGQYFDTSCTGNSGQPENWGADFVAWAWAAEGASTTGLLTSAGGSTPALFGKYGGPSGSQHTSPLYTPQPGDAIVFDSPADYVAIVTAVNADGSIQTTNGDWGGEGPGATTVQNVTIPSGQTAVGSAPDPMKGKTIAEYVNPIVASGANTSLIPFGAITWTPPGSAPQVDIYAADSAGALWDFSHTVGSTAPLGAPRQVASGWTHYEPVGVADFNHDGYPDLAVVDTDDGVIDVFTGSATGLSDTPSFLPYGGGWTNDFTPLGVVDWTHDGHVGVLAVQHSDNTLWFYPGDLTGGSDPNNFHTQIATGWTSNLSPVGVADVTGDGHADILVCDSNNNAVWIYPGDGTGGNAPATELTQCNSGQTFFGLTDYNGDGYPDLLTRDDSTGVVSIAPGPLSSVASTIAAGSATTKALQPFGAITWTPPGATPQVDIYAASSAGTLLDYTQAPNAPMSTTPKTVETGWTHYRPVGVADFNHDGYPDLVALDTNSNVLDVFTGSATGLSSAPSSLPYGGGWTSDFVPFGVADYEHSGHFGVVALQVSTGQMWFYPGDLTGGAGDADNFHTQIGGGWTGAYTPVGVAQFAGHADEDILTCRTDTNELSLYPGSDSGDGPDNYATDAEILTGDCDNDTYFGVTDYNNDGKPDVIVRDNTTGNIMVADGDGTGWWQNTTATTIATAW